MEMRFTVLINADSVRIIMRRRNITHSELAADLSTTADYWSHIVNGRKGVSPRMGKKITNHPVFKGRRWEDVFTMRQYEGI